MRIIVCGGRDFDDHWRLSRVLQDLVMKQVSEGTVLVHGHCATGADQLADNWGRWAKRLNVTVERHPADWRGPCDPLCAPNHRRPRAAGGDYCPLAGFRRNEEMAQLGADLCVAFPGGRGTNDMVQRAENHGIEVMDLREPVAT